MSSDPPELHRLTFKQKFKILEIMVFNYNIEDIEKGMGYTARPSLQNKNKDAQGKNHKIMLGVHTAQRHDWCFLKCINYYFSVSLPLG